ncbi:hypothetical protein K438DRAFT_1633956 [Mycena galopus ATCC 62051]|nr:hypothetical protein K438DRAFT_1633956 [Mycena galopus ATCC 62051]
MSTTQDLPSAASGGIWFKDGTLVIQAGTSSFRVYGGILADRSPVFHDMLGFPQPEDAPTVEGCPVVRLSDAENDVRSFLKALFDYEFFLPYPAKTDFATMAGIIRLSSKYQVESLRKRALVHLSSAFPSDPTEFSQSRSSWTVEGREWIRVILFARELSLDWILPLALYRASALCTSAEVINGIDVDDIHLELTSTDKLMCIEQSISLAKSASKSMIDFLWEPVIIPGCRGTNEEGRWRCTNSRFLSRKTVEGWRAGGTFPLALWMPDDWARLDVCASCMSAMRTAHQEALDTFWGGLPQRFGFPGWSELEKTKEDTLESCN